MGCDKVVCDKVVCERWLEAAEWEAAEEEARDTETKPRTQHKVVGKKQFEPQCKPSNSFANSFGTLAAFSVTTFEAIPYLGLPPVAGSVDSTLRFIAVRRVVRA